MSSVGSAKRGSSPRALAGGSAVAPKVWTGVVALAVIGLLVVLTWPLFTEGDRLQGDYPTDTWLIMHQADSLRQGVFPSYFLHSLGGIFYPVFAFYGGTLFVLSGALSLVIGSAWTTQAVVYVLALAAAYGGWVWLARLAGLRSWQVHAPAILYVTAPYVISNVIVRQDLTEAVATSVVPLLVASVLSVARDDRLRAGPVAALAGSTIVLGGSHNLTLLWGLTILLPAVLVLVIVVPEARRLVTRRGLLRVLLVFVPAMAVNAWYLLPDLAYYSHTQIVGRVNEWKAAVLKTSPAMEAEYLYSVNRTKAPGESLSLALPVLAVAWTALAAALVVRTQWRNVWARVLATLVLTSVAVLVVMTHPRFISVLPDQWQMIQFSFRLGTFVLYGICGGVITALVLVNRSPHRWASLLLLPIMAFSVVGAMGQVRDVPLWQEPLRWGIDNLHPFSTGDFADASEKVVVNSTGDVKVYTRVDVHRDRFVANVKARPGEVIFIDLMTSPQLVDIDGARVVGRWAAAPSTSVEQPRWYLALRIDDDATPGKARIAIREARSLPIVAGRVISTLGLLGLAAIAAVMARAAVRRRREV